MKRRDFLKAAGATATASIVPRHVLGGEGRTAPSEKLNVACIGVGGQGAANVKGLPGFHKEFIAACKGGKPATGCFDYSGPIAETVLLGNVAYRAGGFEWDAQTLTPKGNDAAKALIRETCRQGWSVEA